VVQVNKKKLTKAAKGLARYRKDFPLFAEEILRIQTKEGTLVPFKLNRMQKRLWAKIQQQLENGEPIRWLVLKARQEGCSTFIIGLLYWIVILRSNQTAIVAAHDEDSAKNLYEKAQLFYRLSPPFLQPTLKINNRARMFFSNPDPKGQPGLESQVIVEPSDNVDMGRSWSVRFFHGSEVPRWSKMKDVLVSVKNAMPMMPGTFQFLEGTAQGHNYYKILWDERDERGWEGVFVSWCGSDEYRKEITDDEIEDLKADMYDFEHDVYGNEEVEKALILQELKDWYPEHEEDYLQEREVFYRLAWRRDAIVKLCEKDLQKFRQEYPTCPEHAFETSGKTLFPSIKLSDWRRRAEKAIKDGIIIPQRFRWDAAREDFALVHRGHLTMYEPIRDEHKYVIGADPAMGLHNGDPSAAVLLRLPAMVLSGVFCAVTPPTQFASILARWGEMANTALIACEANDEGGYTVNHHLRKEHRYRRLYRREIHDAIVRKKQMKAGWKTTHVTKDHMINDLRQGITEDELEFYHDELYEQLLAYQELDDGSTGCPEPMHDDIAIALMIAWQMAIHHSAQVGLSKSNRPPKFSLSWWDSTLKKQESADRWQVAS
jgi:hypothetical protein